MSRAAADENVRAALAEPAFRRLWYSLSLSSLGDWLGLLATTAMAAALTSDSSAEANYAVAGVFILRLLPALIFAPIAGVIADRLDRKATMVVTDLGRAALFVSIPIVGTMWWLLVATFLIEVLSLFWIPAKEATVPNLVPPNRLQSANQLSLVTAYGSAPLAAALFTLLSLISGVLGARYTFFVDNSAALALWLNAVTFLVSALTIWSLAIPTTARESVQTEHPLRTLLEGWKFVGGNPLIRGLVLGMLAAFAAAGSVVGLAPTFVRGLGAGNPGYGLLFGSVFLGLGLGMLLGPKVLRGVSRRRMAGAAVVAAGLTLTTMAAVPNLPVVALLTVVLGTACGTAWISGQTLIGLEVSDELRGRTFAFVQSLARLTLVATLAVAPLLSANIHDQTFRPTEDVAVTYSGAAFVFAGAGLIAILVGVLAYRQMDDRAGIPLWRDVLATLRHEDPEPDPIHTGYFLAFEGGDGAGKSTQVERLAQWLRENGHEVVVTREPGATDLGKRLRAALLDVGDQAPSPRAEALMFAADRADHVERVIRPALHRGAVVVTDRYVDSSIAYQGAGRDLAPAEVERLSRWATQGLQPHLTVLLDVDPQVASARRAGPQDRMESESVEFHRRVRQGFLDLAGRDPKRYLVLDADLPPAAIALEVLTRVGGELPDPPHGSGTSGQAQSFGETATGDSVVRS
ncbi:MAG: dTMP kinase [Sporichthyaceae bacterium]